MKNIFNFKKGTEKNQADQTIVELNKKENKPVVALKNLGLIQGYSASSFINKEKVNFDRITVATNLKLNSNEIEPKKLLNGPTINFFAIFDGHDGISTSDNLREKLYRLIIYDEDFLINTEVSLYNAFKKMNDEIKDPFINYDNSGSSVLIILVINNIVYMVSLGKCKCISSINFGEKAFNINKIDKSKLETKNSNSIIDINNYITPKISRGEVPDLFTFKLEKEDFMVILSESIQEKVSNLKILTIIYETLIEACLKNMQPDQLFEECVQNIFKVSIEAKVNGNLTCIIIFFNNFMDMYYSKNPDIIRSRLDNLIKINCDEFYNIKENVIKMKFNKKEKNTSNGNSTSMR